MSEQPDKIRVAVVFGGRSSEHAISCSTAGSVMQAMDPEKYEIVPIGIAHDGRWVLSSAEPERLAIENGKLPEVDPTGAEVVVPSDGASRGLVVVEQDEVPRELGAVDVVLPLLHGPYGEDGTIQGLFEMAGIRYVGSGVLASAASMDKHYTKVVLQGHGIEVGPYVVVRDRDWRQHRDRVLAQVAELGFPVFVKPARAGSSMGVSKATDVASLVEAVETAREHDPKVLVEAMVDGREIECAVLEGLGDDPPEATPPGEIGYGSDHEFYDFEAKYLDEEHLDLHIPADVPAAVAQRARELAVQVFEAMSCEGLARVDFFYTTDGRVLVNELNTMPGFTPMSMFPQLWAAHGLDYPALVDRLIQLAAQRRVGLR
ncbi:MAG: D-alanine--D-alanine ligase [Streptosporangiales bacterium]|nr:D-alanine--D-alanine ligase [Streptosporangiales bacterium]